ncbi:MAG: 16S rRNA (cytosine(1402)-N(4))-methyltransferase RsmH [Myxococcales bacterium]|nr:16S rRNA (cytosine(1402)-N(4))-methyltransferase RsmH [Myxococcales bacterium]
MTQQVRHTPVLLAEVMHWLAPRPGGVYCDATVGFGGHAEQILARSAPDGRLIGLDRDPAALAHARERLAPFGDRVSFVHAPFSDLPQALAGLGVTQLDGCLADLGVSSVQLDEAHRGFSFRREGPLDMRMDPTRGESAADLLARLDEDALATLIRDLGEERYARGVARSILRAQDAGELSGTVALAAAVARGMPRREHHKDPATRTFQALRMAVNDELGQLENFLRGAPPRLAEGGRLVVITFHSLEDRMVKRRFKALADATVRAAEEPALRILTKKVVVAEEEERLANPRSRSAKLRAAERVTA